MVRCLPICLFALTMFELRIVEAADPNAEVLLEKAIAEENVGDLDTAIRLYQAIAAKRELNGNAAARAQFHIGLAQLKRGDRSAAAKAFQLLIEKHPDHKRLVKQARNLMPSIVDEAIELIRANYVDAIDDDELMAAAIRGILDHLDPHSYFYASLEESVGEFWFGEGAEVVIEGDFVGFLGAETV